MYSTTGADTRITRWAYNRIGAASMLSGITGGLLSKGISIYLAPRFLVVSGAVMLIIAGLLSSRAHRKYPLAGTGSVLSTPQGKGADRTSITSNLMLGAVQKELLKQRYVQMLFGISGLSTLAALYIDFQFYAMATISGQSHANFSRISTSYSTSPCSLCN